MLKPAGLKFVLIVWIVLVYSAYCWNVVPYFYSQWGQRISRRLLESSLHLIR